jgi:SP family general alpha glucoside:H+ symporter-like MFS transporter
MSAEIDADIKGTPYASEKDQVEHADNMNDADFKADAMEAELAEHSMTVMQAVRAYPMACFWAFVMSFTIVSFHLSATRIQG